MRQRATHTIGVSSDADPRRVYELFVLHQMLQTQYLIVDFDRAHTVPQTAFPG